MAKSDDEALRKFGEHVEGAVAEAGKAVRALKGDEPAVPPKSGKIEN
jgi:hypothetical protein